MARSKTKGKGCQEVAKGLGSVRVSRAQLPRLLGFEPSLQITINKEGRAIYTDTVLRATLERHATLLQLVHWPLVCLFISLLGFGCQSLHDRGQCIDQWLLVCSFVSILWDFAVQATLLSHWHVKFLEKWFCSIRKRKPYPLRRCPASQSHG